MLESRFQAKLIKELKDRFPECVVLKNDPNYIKGFPDLSVFFQDKWAWLETKRLICTEIIEEVLDELQQAFQPRRKTRVSRSI